MTDFQPIETLPDGVGSDSSGLVTYQNDGSLEVVPYPQTAIASNTTNVLVAQDTADQALADAATAQAAADAAQGDATQALADAVTAQGTADTALTNANKALADVFYDYTKTVDVLDIGEVWEAVGNLNTTLPSDGTYVIGASLTWTYDTTIDSAMWRWRIDGGAWNENSIEPKDVNDKRAQMYAYPDEYVAGSLLIEVEAQKSGAAGTFDVQFLDIFAQRVRDTP
jgi:hypothetical protein